MFRVAVNLSFPLRLPRRPVDVAYPAARAVRLMTVSPAHVRHQLMRHVYVRLGTGRGVRHPGLDLCRLLFQGSYVPVQRLDLLVRGC